MMNFRNRKRIARIGASLLGVFFLHASTSPAQQPSPQDEKGQKANKKVDGSPLYRKHCQKCHSQDGTGTDGRKNFPEIPDFTSQKWQQKRRNAELISSILDGKGDSMPQFGNKLGNEEVKALVDFIRSFVRQENKPKSETSDEFDKEFRELSEQMKELRQQFREMADTPKSEQRPAPQPLEGMKKNDPATKQDSATDELFGQHCGKCHGADGRGAPVRARLPKVPDFTDARWHRQRTDAQLLTSILDGKLPEMPAFRAKISQDQARELVAHIRKFGPRQQGTQDSGSYEAEEKGRSPEPSGDPAGGEDGKTLPEQSFFRQLIAWLGRFHPSIVHFPIGLLLAGTVAELLLLSTGRTLFDSAARFCVWFGSLTALPAATLGWFLAGARLTDPNWVLTVHRWLGTSTAACAVVVLCLCEMSRRARPPPRRAFRLALLLSAVVVLLTGFFGGAIIHGFNYYAWLPQAAAPGISPSK